MPLRSRARRVARVGDDVHVDHRPSGPDGRGPAHPGAPHRRRDCCRRNGDQGILEAYPDLEAEDIREGLLSAGSKATYTWVRSGDLTARAGYEVSSSNLESSGSG